MKAKSNQIMKLNKICSVIKLNFAPEASGTKFSFSFLFISGLDTPVKNFTLSNGFYYKIYADCEKEHREAFERKINGQPMLYDMDNNLQNSFIFKYDCLKQLKMSDKTLSKALDKDKQYNGFYYKTIGQKLKY